MSKAKRKGNKLEYEVRDRFKRYVDPECQRQLMSGADSWNKGDIRFSWDIPHRLMIECKNQEKTSIWAWWKQTTEQCGQFDKPMLVFSRNHHDTLVTLKFEDFMEIYEELVGYIKSAELEAQGNCEHSKNQWKLQGAIKQIKEYMKEL